MFRWVVSSIGLAVLKGEVSAMAQRAARRGALYAVMLILWLFALGFALLAFTVWLSTVVGVIWACVILAGIFALLAVVMQVSLNLTKNRPAETASPLAGIAGATAAATGGGNFLGALAIVGVLGWLLGRQLNGDKK